MEEDKDMEKKRGRPKKQVFPSQNELMLQYQNAPLPVFFVDRQLNVVQVNDYARDHYPSMALPDGLRTALSREVAEDCIRRLENGEDFRRDLPLLRASRAALAFSPIWERDRIVGGIAILTCVAEQELSGMEQVVDSCLGALPSRLNQLASDINSAAIPMTRTIQIRGDEIYQAKVHSVLQSSYQLLHCSSLLNSYLDANPSDRTGWGVVDFWEKLGSLLDASESLLHGNPIPFCYDLPRSPREAARVYCDFRKIATALLCLIDNSFRFTRPGNRVTVTGENAGGKVRIKVTDLGRGIPPEEMDRVFLPFYSRGASGEPLLGQNLGLGLTVARQIIYNHGGALALESTPGEGTTVVFTLPTRDEPLTLELTVSGDSAAYLGNHFSPVYAILCDHIFLPF